MRIHFSKLLIFGFACSLQLALGCATGSGTADTAPDPNHFDPLGKPPSEFTLKAIAADAEGLPFDDTRDFDEAAKGFIAEPVSWKVEGEGDHVVWDLDRYDFYRSDTDFPSVHPSLQRVSRLNMKAGLYEVIPGFYQAVSYTHLRAHETF